MFIYTYGLLTTEKKNVILEDVIELENNTTSYIKYWKNKQIVE